MSSYFKIMHINLSQTDIKIPLRWIQNYSHFLILLIGFVGNCIVLVFARCVGLTMRYPASGTGLSLCLCVGVDVGRLVESRGEHQFSKRVARLCKGLSAQWGRETARKFVFISFVANIASMGTAMWLVGWKANHKRQLRNSGIKFRIVTVDLTALRLCSTIVSAGNMNIIYFKKMIDSLSKLICNSCARIRCNWDLTPKTYIPYQNLSSFNLLRDKITK